MDKKEKIIELRSAQPRLTLRGIGAQVGCSFEYVRQVLLAAGLSRSRSGPRGPRLNDSTKPRVVHLPRWGRQISSHANGRIGELYAAADLLRRGYDVYSSIAYTGGCDLIIMERSEMRRTWRVEVKCATRRKNGNFEFPAPRPNRYDILALVTPDEVVTYRYVGETPHLAGDEESVSI